MTTSLAPDAPTSSGPKPIIDGRRPSGESLLVNVFVIVPLLALVAAVPLAWGWGLGWLDIGLAAVFYVVSCLGVTVGFHRYFTHRAFKATRGLRSALAIAGSLAVQGDVVTWVADHRRHHAFSDKEGDPHSPWLFGTGPVALAKGFWHAHMGWLFDTRSDQHRAVRPRPARRPGHRPDRPAVPAVDRGQPGRSGPRSAGLVTWSWWGALTAFFWAGLVRVACLHHVTWSINSICHMIGDRPFASRDQARELLAAGDPVDGRVLAQPPPRRPHLRPARRLRGQIDISARVIWLFEKARLGQRRALANPAATRPADRRAAVVTADVLRPAEAAS